MKKLKHFRVLYADDNEDDCFMLSVLLKFSDIEVIAVNTVAEAWKLSQIENFDLYLLDVRFPDGDGLELCRRLREYCFHTPILIYSGKAYDSDKEKGLAAGAVGYLTKPYIDDLGETILRAIRFSKNPIVKSYNNYSLESQNQIN